MVVYGLAVAWIYVYRDAKGYELYGLLYPYLIFTILLVINFVLLLRYLYLLSKKQQPYDKQVFILVAAVIFLIFLYNPIYKSIL